MFPGWLHSSAAWYGSSVFQQNRSHFYSCDCTLNFSHRRKHVKVMLSYIFAFFQEIWKGWWAWSFTIEARRKDQVEWACIWGFTHLKIIVLKWKSLCWSENLLLCLISVHQVFEPGSDVWADDSDACFVVPHGRRWTQRRWAKVKSGEVITIFVCFCEEWTSFIP